MGELASTTGEGGKRLYTLVRASFILRGTSFTAWCNDQGLRHANVRAAIIGTWTGPKATEVASRAVDASGAALRCDG
jgi:hypothetical protein